MTNTLETNGTTTPAASALPDPRPNFAIAVATARQVVAGMRPDQFALPTSCPDFDVHKLAGHIVSVLKRIAVIGTGGDPFVAPHFYSDIADDEWLARFDEYAAEIETVWADDAVLTNILTVPWTKLPGAVALMIYVSEITVHTWDLAQATGQSVVWDDGVVAMSLAAMQRGLPDEGRMQDYDAAAASASGDELVPPFSKIVPTPEGAPLIDQLVAFTGRRP